MRQVSRISVAILLLVLPLVSYGNDAAYNSCVNSAQNHRFSRIEAINRAERDEIGALGVPTLLSSAIVALTGVVIGGAAGGIYGVGGEALVFVVAEGDKNEITQRYDAERAQVSAEYTRKESDCFNDYLARLPSPFLEDSGDDEDDFEFDVELPYSEIDLDFEISGEGEVELEFLGEQEL